MKMSFIKAVLMILILLGLGDVHAQSISPTNVRNGEMPCFDCAPTNWFDFGGTPDMSDDTTAATTQTSGGGTTWDEAPLPLPPNGHTHWITIRDIGTGGNEESVGTNITGLIPDREYEIVAYTLTATGTYSPNYIDRFDFQVGTYPRVNVTEINFDTSGQWGTNRLKFLATEPSMQLAFYPGNNAGANSYESVNISVSLNAINTIPVVTEKIAYTEVNVPVTINAFAGALDYDAGQSVVVSTIDLDTDTPGIQSSINTAEGNWTVNSTTGIVSFTPMLGFTGTAVLPYTIQDDYVLDGQPSPGTSTPKNIIINVLQEICTEEVAGAGFELEDGTQVTFNQPATNYGFQFDIYTLDNSFNMEINGTTLATSEIQFQLNQNPNIRFADGDLYGAGGINEIYSMEGNDIAPIVRVVISPSGNITMYGSKVAGGPLFPLELYNGNAFNTITWNNNSTNVVIATQSVEGTTYMTGYGSGLNVAPCDCVKPGIAGVPAGFSQVGILTKGEASIAGWPENVPNGHIVLDAANKGMVVTHMTSDQRDALTAVEGMLIYNTDLNCVQLYRGTLPGVVTERAGWNCIQRGCNE